MSNQQKRKSCVLYVNYFDYVDYLSEHTYRIIKDLLKEFDSVKLVTSCTPVKCAAYLCNLSVYTLVKCAGPLLVKCASL